MNLKLFFLAMIFCTAAVIARANTTDPSACHEADVRKADIAGGVIVNKTKKPLGSVSVTAYSTVKKEKVVYTDANGYYSFTDLTAGTYKLVFEKSGFKKVTKDKVTIQPDEGYRLNIEMQEEDDLLILPGSLFNFNQ